MTSSIAEPFILSSHSVAQTTSKTKGGPKSYSTHATYSKSSINADGFVTVTAQGDGLHVLDVSTMNPCAAHTLGPSTLFSCPAVTHFASNDHGQVCTTFAAIHTSSDITASESGRVIWAWDEYLDSTVSDPASRKRKSILISHPVSHLFHGAEINCAVLALSLKGDITLVNPDFTLGPAHGRLSPPGTVLQSFILLCRECTFLPSSAPLRGVIVVSVLSTASVLRLRVICVDDDHSFVELGDLPLPADPKQFSAASLSPSGFLTILLQDGSWLSFSLEASSNGLLEINQSADPIRLTSLSFISSDSPTSTSCEVSILSLGTSHVLLAGITKSPRELVLLLWDLQYGVALATHTLPIPSNVSQAKDLAINIQLEAAGNHAVLALSPTIVKQAGCKTPASSTSLKSSILLVPVSVPSTSTIANAMGRTALGAQWLTSSPIADGRVDASQVELLAAMRTSMEQNRPQAADMAFFQWLNNDADSSDKTTKSPQEPKPLPYDFVADILTIILQPAKPANMPYSSDALRYLLKRKVVSSSMLNGNLLATLRLRGDWKSINLAFRYVLDITEADLISSLKCVVERHLGQTAVVPESMDIDNSRDILPLKKFLSRCVCYRTTPSGLRSAIRLHLRTPEEINCVLVAIEEWLRQWQEEDCLFAPVGPTSKRQKFAVLPPLPDIISFLQSIFDSTFVLLLSNASSHSLLHSLAEYLDPEVTWGSQIEGLRAALEPFAKAARTTKEGRRREGEGDRRQQRRKHAHEQGLAVGLYRLEHLVL